MDEMNVGDDIVKLEDESVFERAFAAYSVVLVGTKEPETDYNLAPKHMVTPLGWSGYYGFACSPDHGTSQNIKRTEEFTISYPRPDQIVSISLSAETRDSNDEKPALEALETLEAPTIDAPFVAEGYIYLECKLKKIVDDLGENNFIIGEIVNKYVHEDALRQPDRDDADLIKENPILAYLHPERYTEIEYSQAFPFPKKFKK